MRRAGRHRRAWRIVVVVVAAIGLLCIVFDWNWLRRPLERYLTEKSHRTVRIADFHVSFGGLSEFTFRLRGVAIDNAPWADPRPFVTAGELRATCPVASLFDHHPRISRLVIVDADVDLEWQADGLRNWRLTKPDDRGPGVLRILSIEPIRSRIRYVHRGIDLDVQTTSTPLDASAPDAAARPLADAPATPASTTPSDAAPPLAQQVAFAGRYRGAAFEGAASASAVLTFEDTGRPFAIRGHATSGRARLDVDGTVTDVVRHAGGDARVVVDGPTLADASAFAHVRLPQSARFRLEGRLSLRPDAIALNDAKLSVGRGDVAGTVAWRDPSTHGGQVDATLHSERLDVDDLGLGRPVPASATPAATGPADGVHPDLAATVRWTATRIDGARLPTVSDVSVVARAANRVVRVDPLRGDVAGGRVDGTIELDASGATRSVHVVASARELDLHALLRGALASRVEGRVDARADLSAAGDHADALLASVRGSLDASIEHGGVTKRLAAELSLSGVQLLESVLGGSDMVPIRCAVAALTFAKGHGEARRLVVDAGDTHVVGTGTIDLPDRRFSFRLSPNPRDPHVLSLHKSIVVSGAAGHAGIALGDVVDAPVETCEPLAAR